MTACCARQFTVCCLAWPLFPLRLVTTSYFRRLLTIHAPFPSPFSLFCIYVSLQKQPLRKYAVCVNLSHSAALCDHVDIRMVVPEWCWNRDDFANMLAGKCKVAVSPLRRTIGSFMSTKSAKLNLKPHRHKDICFCKYVPVMVLSQEVKAESLRAQFRKCKTYRSCKYPGFWGALFQFITLRFVLYVRSYSNFAYLFGKEISFPVTFI